MPARNSNASAAAVPVAAAAATEATDRPDEAADQNGLSVDDLTLPRSMVQRLAKGVLPANTQIQKDALLALHRSATVFVSYLASHANENTMRTGKKTIQPSDVFEALREVEFENFLPRLEKEHQKFTSIQTDKRNSYRKKVKEEKLAAAAKFAHENTGGTQDAASSPSRSKGVAGDGSPDSATAGASRLDDSPPAAKKARRDGEEMDVEDDDEDANLADDNVDDEEEEEEDEEEVEDEEESGEEGASGEEDEDDEERDKDDLVEDPIESVDKKHEEESSDGDESD